MQPEEITFGQLLNTRYPLIIPKYQRAYAWDKEEVDDFINDITSVCLINLENPNIPKKHFFGGIVSINIDEPGTQTGRRYEIVDGQQRLATFVLALTNVWRGLEELLADQSSTEEEKEEIQAHIDLMKENFIKYDEIESGMRVSKQRLTLSHVDKQYFQDLIDGRNVSPSRASHTRLAKAHSMLYDRLVAPIVHDKNISIRQRLQSVIGLKNCLNEHSYFIHIWSRDRAEAYKLFSVLNDRGMSLSDGDLLRSRTLELLEGFPSQQERVVSCWDQILAGNTADIDKYLKCYYASHRGERAPQRDMFDKFSEHFFNFSLPLSQADADELASRVKNLSDEQEGYNSIIDGEWPYTNHDVSQKVVAWDKGRLRILTTLFRHALCYPLLESSWVCLPEVQFSELVQALEKFAFRYIIVCGNHPGTAESVYYNYARRIRQNPSSFDLGAFKSDLRDLINSSAPDTLFDEQLVLFLNYSQSNKRKFIKYFLTTIESYLLSQGGPRRRRNRSLSPDKMITINFDQTTIEHIYPQNARSNMIDESIEPYKHTIGNLSIWAPTDNNKASNLPFQRKISMYQQSSLALNRHLATLADWNIDVLDRRKQDLLDMAKRIFTV